MYLGPKQLANFKPEPNPNRKKKESAASKRPGMDPKHLEFIRKLPSCISGRRSCEAHHLQIKSERGVGLKATDRWAVPLTREEHMEIHKFGSKKEEEWFLDRGVACYVLARALYNASGNRELGEKIIAANRRAEWEG